HHSFSCNLSVRFSIYSIRTRRRQRSPAASGHCMNRSEHAFVIGGGPAGLVAAIALRRKGLRVTVADGGDAPSDKACGEGILPEGLAALERLGVALDWSAGRAFRGI